MTTGHRLLIVVEAVDDKVVVGLNVPVGLIVAVGLDDGDAEGDMVGSGG
eukprot:CAMPEP_0195272096 /NCGR_PEP_ID=MMETSP0706-20130129/15541_1 /TAXON_ID=33640 /ORGANISM="Asterionellopsis glacialis, Strain CCMP134" /LENGTH=48 /DNA_ID= /DNA_START= /DNA_END= /DNA_ORIENTATION=